MSHEGVGEGGEVLWAGAQLRAVMFNARADRLVVTFDHYNKDKLGFPACVASTLFTQRGYANLRLQTAGNDWYINEETDALSDAVSEIVHPYRFRAALGYSMGGYAAFRFSRAIGVQWVVAVSPQVSLARAEMPREWRWKEARQRFDRQKGSLRPLANRRLRGMVLFDPMIRLDLTHARELHRLFPSLRMVPLSFAGHPASPLFADLGQQGLVRQAALDPEIDPFLCLRAYREGRRRVARYWENRAHRLQTYHPLAAQAALDALAALKRNSDA